MAKGLTQRRIETLKPQAVRREIPDGLVPGLYLIAQPSGVKSWAVRYRVNGRSRKYTLGSWPALALADARGHARDALIKAKRGIDPGDERKALRRKAEAAAADTVKAICEQYLRREGKRLRTADQRRATLERLVFSQPLGNRPIAEVKRSEINRLLDHVEDTRGPRMADDVLAVLRKIFNWHATRDDDFKSPVVRGMARTKPKERARHRTLSDDEIVRVWAAAESMPVFGPFIQLLLLTSARRNELARARWSEFDGGDWTLPAARNKTKVDLVRPLSATAQAVLAKVIKVAGCDYVFSTDSKHPISGFAKFKRNLDKASGTSGWTLHDARRSARSLMSRAGVSSDHAEHCLGHVLPGVRGTYDRHAYYEEKKRAFEALSAQIDRILHPQDNVTPLSRSRA